MSKSDKTLNNDNPDKLEKNLYKNIDTEKEDTFYILACPKCKKPNQVKKDMEVFKCRYCDYKSNMKKIKQGDSN